MKNINNNVKILSMNELTLIGQSEHVELPELSLVKIPARIDTGAKISTIWASDISVNDGSLSFVLFDKKSKYFTGKTLTFTEYEQRDVKSSNGISESRYVVKFLVIIKGRKIRARFTLANRSKQTYPVLIGRNILRRKFVVDVAHNHVEAETDN